MTGSSRDRGSAPGFRPPPKPGGVRLLLFKAPAYLYRLHLGWLLGKRFLLLIHRGRRSGRIYSTVLEVVRYDPETEESIVTAAYGERADWYRNIKAQPALEVITGRHRYVPEQRFLTSEEVSKIWHEYEGENPRLIRMLVGVVGGRYDGSEEARHQIISFVRMVAFGPKGAAPPRDRGSK